MALPSPLDLPLTLRPIAHFLKIASEYENRDPVISYWCRLAALQAALKLDKKSPEAVKVLVPLMDWLEKEKKVLKDNEAVSSEIVANAHIDNFATKLFTWADKEDRAAHFNKNVVKAFYTAGNLYEVLHVFGEMTPENDHHQRYAKWKAAYIHNCLKNGETPIAGPLEGAPQRENGDEDQGAAAGAGTSHSSFDQPGAPSAGGWNQPVPAPRKPAQPTFSDISSVPQPVDESTNESGYTSQSAASGNSKLTPDMTAKAQKYCRFAASSLDYDDTTTAVDYLQKALRIIQTGKE